MYIFGKIFLLAVTVLAAAVPTDVGAQQRSGDSWVLLGTRAVDLKLDTDTLDVTTAKGRFKGLRLIARHRGVVLSRVQVVYNDGTIHHEDRRIALNPGDRTRPIDLRRDERFVDRIKIFYRTEPGALLPATIEVWGLQSREGASAARPALSTGGLAATSVQPDRTARAQPTAEDDPTTLLGMQYVDRTRGQSVVRIDRTLGLFDRIRFRSHATDLHLKHLSVSYADGTSQVLATDAMIKADSESRWLAVNSDRFIRHVALTYHRPPVTAPGARIEIVGRVARDWLTSSGKGRSYNGGWVYLGAQTPLFFSFKKGLVYQQDTIRLPASDVVFAKLRIDVRHRAITLKEVAVNYADGTKSVLALMTKVEAGSAYGPLPLKPRPVLSIDITCRTRLLDASARDRGYARVEFWAQH